MGDMRKNILQTDFEREKKGKMYLGKRSCTEKKYLYAKKILKRLYVREKNSNSRGLRKEILIQTKSPNPPIPPPQKPISRPQRKPAICTGTQEAFTPKTPCGPGPWSKDSLPSPYMQK